MLYILSGIIGLLVIVALFTFIRSKKSGDSNEEETTAPPADCCGAHAICEKGLKKADTHIEYFNDEELDEYKQIPPEDYTDEQIEAFRDVLYTLRQEELEDWLISLEKRGINYPTVLRAETYDMLP